MNKERKKSNFLRSLLTTASIASVIVGSSSAFGVETRPNRPLASADNREHWSAAAVVADRDTILFDNAHPLNRTVTIDVNLAHITFNTGGVANIEVSVHNPLGVDAIIGTQSLKFIITDDAGDITLGENGIEGNFEGLKNIDFASKAATVTISGDKFNSDVAFLSTGGPSGTVTINANDVILRGNWSAGNDAVSHLVVNDTKSVTITNHLVLSDNVTLGGNANTAGGTITFTGNVTVAEIKGADAGTGTVIFAGNSVVTSKVGHTTKLNTIEVKDGSTVDIVTNGNAANVQANRILLSGVDSTLKFSGNRLATILTDGITAAGDGCGILQLDGNLAYNINVAIGTKDKRLKELKFTHGGADLRRVQTEAFIDAISADGGPVTFDHELNVNTTNLTGPNATTLNLTKGGNLGIVDFHNVNSIINVAAGKNLSGDFCGDRNLNKKHNDKRGQLHFAAGNSEFDGTVTNLDLIVHAGGGTLKFLKKGHNIVTTIHGANDSIFAFVDGYKLTGNIDTAKTLNLENAEIAGNITNVGEINLVKDKTLMIGGTTVDVKTIFFGNAQDKGGTLAFNAKDDVTLTTTGLGELFSGNIDTTKMKAGKTLTINSNIGGNPTVADSMAFDKIALSGQNLNLRPLAAGFVNIAVMDFNDQSSIVALKTPGVNYTLGELKKAKQAKIEISEDVSLLNTKTTGEDKLQGIHFKADKTLTISDGIDITATEVTTDKSDQGNIVFAKTGTLKGNIGTSAKNLKTLKVNEGIEATTSGKAYFKGDISLGNNAVLVVDNDYTANKVIAESNGSGIVRFVNKDAVTFKTAAVASVVRAARTAVLAANAIDKLDLQGGNVKLVGKLEFKKIAFAKDSTLALADDMKLEGIEVESTVADADKRPTIQLASKINDKIIAGQNIGSEGHSVNLEFSGDTVLDFASQNAFVAITTASNDKGTVNFDLGGASVSTIDGLGSENHKLKLVNLKTAVINRGNTYAKVVVHDGIAYEAGETVDGAIHLGHTDAGGASTVTFRDNVILKADMTSVGAKNSIAFAGNAEISSKTFGTANNAFETINFTGDNTHTATLKSSDLYANNINFGNENIKVAASKVVLHGVSQINANINLESNQLIFKKSGTWGKETSINTVLTEEGSFGNIVLEDKVVLADNVGVTVKISDNADVTKYNNKLFTLVDGVNHLNGGALNLEDVKGVEHNRAYVNWGIIIKDNKLMFERKVDIEGGIKADLKKIGVVVSDENVKRFMEAQGFVNNDLSFMSEYHAEGEEPEKYKKLRADAVDKIFSNSNAKVTSHIKAVGDQVTNIVSNKANNAVVGAGSDDASMGAWAMPYYSQATQKKSGDDAGYGVKSFGGVVGFDTLVNDDLTIGAALSFVKSDMKYKGDYAGKTEIGTFMGSIYAAQSLPQNFFVQAVASLGSSKIKGTDPRIVSTKTHSSGQETAKADYGTMSYGGEVLFGYNAKIADSALLTPMAGIRYTRFNDESYKETGTTNQNKIVGERGVNNIEAIVGAKVSTSIDTDGVVVTPEAHAFVSQKLGGDKSGKVNVRLEGMTDSFITKAEKAAKTSFNVGLGVIAKAGVMEYGAGYDAYIADKYIGHQGTLKVRVNF